MAFDISWWGQWVKSGTFLGLNLNPFIHSVSQSTSTCFICVILWWVAQNWSLIIVLHYICIHHTCISGQSSSSTALTFDVMTKGLAQLGWDIASKSTMKPTGPAAGGNISPNPTSGGQVRNYSNWVGQPRRSYSTSTEREIPGQFMFSNLCNYLQSSAIIMRSSITWYCIHQFCDWGRIYIGVLTHKRHPLSRRRRWGGVWRFCRKLTVL